MHFQDTCRVAFQRLFCEWMDYSFQIQKEILEFSPVSVPEGNEVTDVLSPSG